MNLIQSYKPEGLISQLPKELIECVSVTLGSDLKKNEYTEACKVDYSEFYRMNLCNGGYTASVGQAVKQQLVEKNLYTLNTKLPVVCQVWKDLVSFAATCKRHLIIFNNSCGLLSLQSKMIFAKATIDRMKHWKAIAEEKASECSRKEVVKKEGSTETCLIQ